MNIMVVLLFNAQISQSLYISLCVSVEQLFSHHINCRKNVKFQPSFITHLELDNDKISSCSRSVTCHLLCLLNSVLGKLKKKKTQNHTNSWLYIRDGWMSDLAEFLPSSIIRLYSQIANLMPDLDYIFDFWHALVSKRQLLSQYQPGNFQTPVIAQPAPLRIKRGQYTSILATSILCKLACRQLQTYNAKNIDNHVSIPTSFQLQQKSDASKIRIQLDFKCCIFESSI